MTILDELYYQVGNEARDAAETLSAFIESAATKTADEVGFGYTLVTDAPDIFSKLHDAYAHSLATGEPLPISSENSDDIIYRSCEVNGALRFWHDVNHVRRRLSFELVDELELSLWHLGELEAAGHKRGSVAWRLLHADLTGQTYVQAFAQRFPFDQRRFVKGCVTAGFDHGLLNELRRGGNP